MATGFMSSLAGVLAGYSTRSPLIQSYQQFALTKNSNSALKNAKLELLAGCGNQTPK